MATHSNTLAGRRNVVGYSPWGRKELGHATVQGVTESQTRLSDFTFLIPRHFFSLLSCHECTVQFSEGYLTCLIAQLI